MTYGTNIYGLLTYNESKVEKGKASFLMGQNFVQDDKDLTFKNKWDQFKLFTELNGRTKKNAYHFSLNFHKEDMPFLNDSLKKEIATEYLSRLGLDNQPALVYEHFDAAHPHLHIVTTNIDSDGKRMNFYRKIHEDGEKVRKGLEIEYNLTQAEGRNQEIDVPELNTDRVVYGRDLTKESLSKVISKVRSETAFTNLDEYQECLAKYGVTVDPGKEDSPQFKNGGLVYGFVDMEGNQVGQGIKASRFYGSPVLENLKKDFSSNVKVKQEHFTEVAQAVNSIYYDHLKLHRTDFRALLIEQGIDSTFDINKFGHLENISYYHKASGAIYQTGEFKLNIQRLYEKIGDYTYSYEEAKNLSKEIARQYRSMFRDSKMIYETQFFESLDTQDFLDHLRANSQMNYEQLSQAVDNFFQYKTEKKGDILKKDLDKFNRYAVPIIKYAAGNSTLSTEKKAVFLSKMGIIISEPDGHGTFHSREFEKISLRGNTGAHGVLHTDREGLFNDQRQEKEFTKKQKQFFSALARKAHTTSRGFNHFHYLNWFVKPYVDEKDHAFLETKINEVQYDQVIQQKSIGRIKNVDDIFDHGLIVKPISSKDNSLPHYIVYHNLNKEEYAVPISQALTEYLHKQKFDLNKYQELLRERTTSTGKYHFKYKIAVVLNNIQAKGEYDKLDFVYNALRGRHSQMAWDIYEKLTALYKDRIPSGEELSKMTEYMLDRVKEKDYGDFGKTRDNEKALHKGGKDPQGGIYVEDNKNARWNAGDYEESQAAKRARKRWKNDLDHEL